MKPLRWSAIVAVCLAVSGCGQESLGLVKSEQGDALHLALTNRTGNAISTSDDLLEFPKRSDDELRLEFWTEDGRALRQCRKIDMAMSGARIRIENGETRHFDLDKRFVANAFCLTTRQTYTFAVVQISNSTPRREVESNKQQTGF